MMKTCKVNFAFFFDYQLFKTPYFSCINLRVGLLLARVLNVISGFQRKKWKLRFPKKKNGSSKVACDSNLICSVVVDSLLLLSLPICVWGCVRFRVLQTVSSAEV